MFVEITRGRSFKGLAQYCLHDVDAQTDERVSFVATRNVATDDPQIAWRIMAARHYLQDDLKAKAGVGRGGAKDGKPVGHLLISWKREEAQAEQLTPHGMLNAANGALRAIGAAQHQALIIGHTDTEHPHCHIIVNLIGDDGRLKKNWKEKEKLSKFALKREREIHGEAIVKTREKNWLDREAGETPTPVKKKPRHLYELDKASKQCPQMKAFTQDHKRKLAELERAKAAQKLRHKRHQQQSFALHQERGQRTKAATDLRIRSSRSEVRKACRQHWHELLNEQEAERRSFDRNERNLKGSLANAMKLIEWKKVLRRKWSPGQPGLSDVFHLLTSEAVRRQRLKERQQAELDKLRLQQRQKEEAQVQALQDEQHAAMRRQRHAFVEKSAAMKERQSRSHRRLKEQQQELTRERNDVLKAFRERELQNKRDRVRTEAPSQKTDRQLRMEWQHVNSEAGVEQASEEARSPVAAEKPARIRRPRKERAPRQPRNREEPVAAKTRPIDILPQDEKAAQVAKLIDDFEERMMKRMQEQQHHRDRGH